MVRPQVCAAPASMSWNLTATPFASVTSVGVVIVVDDDAADSCEPLPPQHQVWPSSRRAHTRLPPAVIWTIADGFETETGESFSPPMLPCPFWPTSLSPQHHTSPSRVMPHANQSPTATCA